jgi:para-nitrobenzyl esterase
VLTGRPLNKENAAVHYPVSAEAIGVNFAKRYHIEGTDAAALAKLRALSAAEIVDDGQETAGPGGPPTYSGPILDGKLVVETAESAYRAGRVPQVPIIIGSNSAEVPAGFVNATTKEQLLGLFGDVKPEATKVYDPDGNTELAKMLTLVNTDKVWAEPARFTAKAYATKGQPAYVYLFAYVSPAMQQYMRYGAAHASEIPYVFGSIRSQNDAPVAPKDQEVATLMNTYWANFAKTGNPNGKGLPGWPVYNATKNELIEFRPDGSAVGEPDPKKARLDVIEKAVTSGSLR